MKIRLKSFFHYDLSQVLDRGMMELEGRSPTLRDLLNEISLRSGGKVRAIDPKTGEMDVEFFVLLNGREVPAVPQGLETEIHDGDEVGIGLMHFWGGG
ncbi:MAG: MoaD/ThiS family protein [Chloroflexi bacterium]|nr:MoaD/ThiS family protein [Chloroflexota bacterium]